MQPTIASAQEFQTAYDHYNVVLFNSQLPQCLITLQRVTNCLGYFSSKKFVAEAGITDEIAMNPEFFTGNPIIQTLQTLVHEMVHLWQYHFGTPSLTTYHNIEWANKMEPVGLMPSSTGAEGGARTGQNMSDYPIIGGQFLAASERLIAAQFQISFGDRIAKYLGRPASREALTEVASVGLLAKPIASPLILRHVKNKVTRADRVKFQCEVCGLSAWAKPSANLMCGDCDETLAPIVSQSRKPVAQFATDLCNKSCDSLGENANG